jgi:hypothetical protein
MPLAALTGIRNPAAASTQPLMLRCNYNDITRFVPIDSYSLTDSGVSAPQQLSFMAYDRTVNVGAFLTAQALIQWSDEVAGTMLYQGYIKDVQGIATGPYPRWTVTCNDLSECLDFARPIIAATPTGTDQAQILSLVAQYSFLNVGVGGFVQQLAATMPVNQLQMTTLRNAIDATLALTGVPGAAAMVDAYGRLHTLSID